MRIVLLKELPVLVPPGVWPMVCQASEARGELVEHFNSVVPHPAGSDLLFYAEEGADDSAEGIIQTIAEWCATQGLPGLKNP